ncbi:TPA: hypothetical protein QH305_003407 [Klebsiella aerogenes]|nr:hypothetical protein [Klebsiella aerogenes]
MLMIIFYSLRAGLANRSEYFVIGLTQYLHIFYLFIIYHIDIFIFNDSLYFSGAETGCTWQDYG